MGSGRGGNCACVTAILAGLAGVLGTLALLAVFVFWGAGNDTSALPYFAVVGVLLGLCGWLGARSWH